MRSGARRARRWGVLALLAACACGQRGPSPSPPGTGSEPAGAGPAPPALRLELSHTGGVWAARLTNRGNAPVRVVRPGDGSTWGARTPILEWIVEDERGEVVSQDGGARCGNYNALGPGEVVDLAPGEGLECDAWLGAPRLGPAGTYRVSLRWTNDPRMTWAEGALGTNDPDERARVRSSAAFTVTSEPIEVTAGGAEGAGEGPR